MFVDAFVHFPVCVCVCVYMCVCVCVPFIKPGPASTARLGGSLLVVCVFLVCGGDCVHTEKKGLFPMMG